MTRFEAQHSPRQLLDIVRAVSVAASPKSPAQATQRAWDATRANAGHPDVPQARAIVQRLGVPWERLLRIAHSDPDDALRALGNASADKGRKGHTLPRIATAMRQAAVRLDKPAITRTDYRRGRDQILAGARDRAARAIAERALPELTQIETVLGQHDMSWDDALIHAGLQLPEPSAGSRGLDVGVALRVFAEQSGKLPRSANQLVAWANAQKVSIRRPPRARFEQAVTELQAGRAAAGQPELPVAGRGEHRDAPGVPVGSPAARKRQWSKAEIIIGLARAIHLLGRGGQLTQRTLKDLAADHSGHGIPSWSSVDRCRRRHHPDETWVQWRHEAEQLAARTPSP